MLFAVLLFICSVLYAFDIDLPLLWYFLLFLLSGLILGMHMMKKAILFLKGKKESVRRGR